MANLISTLCAMLFLPIKFKIIGCVGEAILDTLEDEFELMRDLNGNLTDSIHIKRKNRKNSRVKIRSLSYESLIMCFTLVFVSIHP